MKKILIGLFSAISLFAFISCDNNTSTNSGKSNTVDVEKDESLDESGLGEDNFELSYEE